jgi:hypothetical protein
MIFLLHAHQQTGEQAYLDAALRIGAVIRSFKNQTGLYQGFLGGINNPEATPTARPWASTEHNIDVMVAARLAYEITGDPTWREDARHALEFVEAMYDDSIGLYRSGTTDPSARNQTPGQLPADVNTWAILADPATLLRHPQLLDNVLMRFRTTDAGFDGLDFNDDLDGVQFEMTAHLVLAMQTAGRDTEAQYFLNELTRAQTTAPFGDGQGIAAASRDGLTTGFDNSQNDPFFYYRLKHVGATAWTALAHLGVNPYSQLPAEYLAADYDGSGVVDGDDLVRWKSAYGKASGAVAFEGDADGDRDVDGADFLTWQRQRGLDALPVASSFVPEASASQLIVLAIAGVLGLSRISKLEGRQGAPSDGWRLIRH